MAHANSAIQVSELDFDNIRSSLKTFMSGQSKFQANYEIMLLIELKN